MHESQQIKLSVDELKGILEEDQQTHQKSQTDISHSLNDDE
jgi:hypothetical protein